MSTRLHALLSSLTRTRKPLAKNPKQGRRGIVIEVLEARIAPAVTVVAVPPTLSVDTDGDGLADPGDRLHYTVTVSNNTGSPLTNLTFQDLINDPNLSLVN